MGTPPEAQPYVGITLVDRYRVGRYIGQGYFSYVYEGVDMQASRPVAVKLLKPEQATADAITEMNTERDLLRRLAHRDHVPDCYEGEQHIVEATMPGATVPMSIPLHFIAMELAAGSLDEVVAARHKVAWKDRLLLFRAAAKALHQLHASGVAHRDFKSSNVLLFTSPGAPLAKVGDLGRSAAWADERRWPAERYEFARGDRGYAPPELLWGAGGDERGWYPADLYLLGSLLCELATGLPLTAYTFKMVTREALPFVNESADRRRAEFRQRVTIFDSVYERAWADVERELSPPIRQIGGRLARQLTDPDPSRRGPGGPARSVRPWDLNWVLQRTDIMIRILDHEAHQQQRLAAKRQRRARR